MEESDEYEMELGQNRENALETDQGKKYLLKKFFCMFFLKYYFLYFHVFFFALILKSNMQKQSGNVYNYE